MMSDSCVRIERFENGFTVGIRDPAIDKRNNLPYEKREKMGVSYTDPWKSFVFKDADGVVAFLKKNLKKAIVQKKSDDFGTAFDTAASEPDGDE